MSSTEYRTSKTVNWINTYLKYKFTKVESENKITGLERKQQILI